MTVCECARLQTFPDDYEFLYSKLDDGCDMVSNAVPFEMARIIAENLINAIGD